MEAMKGRTVLVIAHNDTTLKLADQVARLGSSGDAGSTVINVTSTAEFFKSGGICAGDY